AAMPNGRCKVAGGKSTGPRTPEGLERSKRARWKHGYYSREAKAERSRVRAAMLALRYLRMLGHQVRAWRPRGRSRRLPDWKTEIAVRVGCARATLSASCLSKLGSCERSY